MTRENMVALRKDLIGDLENKIQEIYLEYQKSLGIKHGDQPLKLAADEELEIATLANTIAETLMFQKMVKELYKGDKYRLYVASDNAMNFMILEEKVSGKHLIFNWDLSDDEIIKIAWKFYNVGLTENDFENTTWEETDFRDEIYWSQEADDYVNDLV